MHHHAIPCLRSRPMTLGNMRSLAVTCELCHHEAVLSVHRWTDASMVRAFRPHMVCTRCGIVGADARPNWREMHARGNWREMHSARMYCGTARAGSTLPRSRHRAINRVLTINCSDFDCSPEILLGLARRAQTPDLFFPQRKSPPEEAAIAWGSNITNPMSSRASSTNSHQHRRPGSTRSSGCSPKSPASKSAAAYSRASPNSRLPSRPGSPSATPNRSPSSGPPKPISSRRMHVPGARWKKTSRRVLNE